MAMANINKDTQTRITKMIRTKGITIITVVMLINNLYTLIKAAMDTMMSRTSYQNFLITIFSIDNVIVVTTMPMQAILISRMVDIMRVVSTTDSTKMTIIMNNTTTKEHQLLVSTRLDAEGTRRKTQRPLVTSP